MNSTDTMTETTLANLMLDILLECDDFQQGEDIASVSTYQQVGMLTTNAGVVLRLRGGSEFQMTIVQSRDADEPNADDEDEMDVESLLMLDPEKSDSPEDADEALRELGELVEMTMSDDYTEQEKAAFSADIELLAATIRPMFSNAEPSRGGTVATDAGVIIAEYRHVDA